MIPLFCVYFSWSCVVVISPWGNGIAWSVLSRLVDRRLRVVVVGGLLISWSTRWSMCLLLMLGWVHYIVSCHWFGPSLLGLLSELGCSWAWMWLLYAHRISVYWISCCASDYTVWHVLECDVFQLSRCFTTDPLNSGIFIIFRIWWNIGFVVFGNRGVGELDGG